MRCAAVRNEGGLASKIGERKAMKKIRQILIGLFNIVYNIFLRYSQAVLLVIVVIVSADVFCRNVLSYSIKWAQEVSLLLIVWMTFLSMAIGEEKDQHIAIELFYNLFPKPVRKFFDVLNKMILAVVGCFLCFFGTKLVMSTWSSTLAATKWPAGMLYLMIPVGGGFMAFFAVLDLLGWKKYKNTNQYGDQLLEASLDDGGQSAAN